MNVLRKIFKAFCILLFIIVLLAFVAVALGILFFKSGNNAPVVFGYRITMMNNETMEPIVPNGSLILSKAEETPQPNSIVMFSADNSNVYTVARYLNLQNAYGRDFYILKADNAEGEIILEHTHTVETVVYASKKAGSFIKFATSYKGVFVCAILPCGLLILLEIIIGVGSKRRKKKAKNIDETSESVEETLKEQETTNEDSVVEMSKEEETEDIKKSETKSKKDFDRSDEDIDNMVDDILDKVN